MTADQAAQALIEKICAGEDFSKESQEFERILARENDFEEARKRALDSAFEESW